MFKNKKIISVIPARGGSKTLPDKNIKELWGKPLIAWTIEEAKRSQYIDRLIVSSDSRQIIDVAKTFQCEAPFVRPAALAEDHVPSVDVLIHALEQLPESYDYAVILQCTSPLRLADDIDGGIQKCVQHRSGSCLGVSRARSHPNLLYRLDQERMVPVINNGNSFLPRQKFSEVFEINGALYVVDIERLRKKRTLIFQDSVAYRMDESRSIDIDTPQDFLLAEAMLDIRKSIKR